MKRRRQCGRIAILALVLGLLSWQTAFAQMSSIINRSDKTAQADETHVIFQSDANNPKESTRYEGVPNLLATGNATGYVSYKSLGGGNYCTQMKTNPNGPYIYFNDRIYTEGTYIIEFDLAKNNTGVQTNIHLHGVNAEGGSKLWLLALFNVPGSIAFSSEAQGIVQENYNQLKTYKCADPPTAETWYHLRMELDLGTMTYDLYINDLLMCHNTPVPASYGMVGVKGFRVTQAGSATSDCTVYLDNYYVGYEPLYNTDLGFRVILNWNDRSDSIVRRVPIQTDRRQAGVVPKQIDGVQYMPLRYLADCYRASIGYEDETQTITLGYGEHTYQLQEGGDSYTEDGALVSMSGRVIIEDGITLIPLEAAAKMLNFNVFFEDDRLMITEYSSITEEDFAAMFAYWEEKL